MRLGGVLENLLYATLYSSYNIDEAAPSLNKLIESLSSQQGADELGQLYVPTMRNAGYLTYALGYEEVAGALYVKAVLASLKTSDTRAQAASYFDLANFYKVTGKTDKATESFVKAYELYKLSGDKEKMSDIDRQPIFKDALKDRPNKDSLTRQPGTSRRP
jgi:tetratricopeptide (TPR) repeat protein